MAKSDLDRVWEFIEKESIGLLTTQDGEELRTRPMGINPKRAEDAIYLLTDAKTHKADEIDKSYLQDTVDPFKPFYEINHEKR